LPDVYLGDEGAEVYGQDDGPEGGEEGERPFAADGVSASAETWGTLELRPGADAKSGIGRDVPRGARRVHPRARLESIYASADASESSDQMIYEQMIREYTAGDAGAGADDATGPP
jgi:hypothetical protein